MIYRAPSAQYQPLPENCRILKQESFSRDGVPWVRFTYTSPSTGEFTREFRVSLAGQPRVALIDTPAGGALATLPLRPLNEELLRSTIERRSIPRADRDRRVDVPGVENNGEERRTGGPLESFFDEAKAFVARPAGMATVAIVLALVIFRVASR